MHEGLCMSRYPGKAGMAPIEARGMHEGLCMSRYPGRRRTHMLFVSYAVISSSSSRSSSR